MKKLYTIVALRRRNHGGSTVYRCIGPVRTIKIVIRLMRHNYKDIRIVKEPMYPRKNYNVSYEQEAHQ